MRRPGLGLRVVKRPAGQLHSAGVGTHMAPGPGVLGGRLYSRWSGSALCLAGPCCDVLAHSLCSWPWAR